MFTINFIKFKSALLFIPFLSFYTFTNSLSNIDYDFQLNQKSAISKPLLAQTKQQDWFQTPHASIYGYNNSLLIAQVVNATLDQVAFTSFESDDKGYWNYSGTVIKPTAGLVPGKTGNNYYSLSSGAITRSNLPAGRYIISYWTIGSSSISTITISGTNLSIIRQKRYAYVGNYTFYEHIVSLSATGSVTLSGPANVDEVRLHPEIADMITYTYSPLVGKTSQTDANGRTIYYEYDEFNRLQYIKDQEGNIIKRVTYVFKS
ncbi:RHS repeat protein [Cytophagaceae bacterium DM2B3-1]|uniref:RHS repeat protein n=1 Tax=Xanthocytophaga flava TaxID=3048013 RepID=A0ABT7CYF3_9BACT|nr:RHS repeat domain-containing protein [Xanthocytophaga flavus]MDJ1497619.1 RHS repeat protein [Xanthocytophaga flavus]